MPVPVANMLDYYYYHHHHHQHLTTIIQDNRSLAGTLRTGGFCWSKVLLPTCPCWWQL